MKSTLLPCAHLVRDLARKGTFLTALWLGWGGVLLATPVAARDRDGLAAACNSAHAQTVLHAAPAGAPATSADAYWLNHHLLQWPKVAVSPDGRFRLYHSRNGQILARVGAAVGGADGSLALEPFGGAVPTEVVQRFKFVAPGVVLAVHANDAVRVPELVRDQLVLVQEDAQGKVLAASSTQLPGALDDLYVRASDADDLGAQVTRQPVRTQFRLWAPTAQDVSVCLYRGGATRAATSLALQRDARSGLWEVSHPADLSGQYYAYLVDVFVPGVGLVRNRVTDPYSVSLTTDSRRSYIADLDAPELKPVGWEQSPVVPRVAAQTDMVIYELHVRDFSANDRSVKVAHRGKYLAFTNPRSNGMRHLRALSAAGVTDVHLLPVFDLASVPEQGCVSPRVPLAPADSEAQQAAVMATAARDCFNWGYDPFHFNAPEGSYATDAANGAVRIREFREMVLALHKAGLRVGMDVVYNHTAASGQSDKSVLDRIVPGYYHRLDAHGVVERSTCCDNTATEHLMMGKLMTDSVALWARHYKIDSFRFDLMAHQPRDVMVALKARLRKAVGREVNLIGEGWNFGEVANGARFPQASQLMLNGTGIGTFSDRGRDAIRGGSAADAREALVRNQGYINGLLYDPNPMAGAARPVLNQLKMTADLVRVGLAGSLREYAMTDHTGASKTLQQLDYNGQPAGYVSQPGEVVNYVENHDNQTLFDINAYRLPANTSGDDRVRVQMLGVALNALSQGVAYFHAGVDTLRSKSLDGNSFDSGDWFNRIDWSYQDNYFGTGLPPAVDNRAHYPWMRPLLGNPAIKPTPTQIRLARDMFRDLLRIRASTSLLRLRTAEDVARRLRFYNTGPDQNPVIQAGHLDGKDYAGAKFQELLYFVNVGKAPQELVLPEEKGKPYTLHPVHQARGAADQRPRLQARYESATGRFILPARTALVFVVR